MILNWRFGDCVKVAKLIYIIIDLLQAWVFLHAVRKSANLKSRQQCFLRKLPNIMFAYIFAYMVYPLYLDACFIITSWTTAVIMYCIVQQALEVEDLGRFCNSQLIQQNFIIQYFYLADLVCKAANLPEVFLPKCFKEQSTKVSPFQVFVLYGIV